jgi:outer membrane protein TolC
MPKRDLVRLLAEAEAALAQARQREASAQYTRAVADAALARALNTLRRLGPDVPPATDIPVRAPGVRPLGGRA